MFAKEINVSSRVGGFLNGIILGEGCVLRAKGRNVFSEREFGGRGPRSSPRGSATLLSAFLNGGMRGGAVF